MTKTKEQALEACPICGGPVTDVKDHEQFVVDLPAVPPPVTRYLTHSGQCARCGQRVRSRHPEQISEATGAAGVVIGPRAKALAADLKHRLGVPYGERPKSRKSALVCRSAGADCTRRMPVWSNKLARYMSSCVT